MPKNFDESTFLKNWGKTNTTNYILNGKTPVLATNLLEWGLWWAKSDGTVKRTELEHGIVISTVFLGIDRQFGKGEPLLFETAVVYPVDPKKCTTLGIEINQELDIVARCSTWQQAEKQHELICQRAKKDINHYLL